MKRILYLLLICLSLLCESCILQDQRGYPSKVTFSKHGGEKKIYGEDSFYNFSVESSSAVDQIEYSYTSADGDTLFAKCKWLTVQHIPKNHELIIVAEPNTTKKKRKVNLLTSSMRTPKFIREKWCDTLMTFHEHCFGDNLFVLR